MHAGFRDPQARTRYLAHERLKQRHVSGEVAQVAAVHAHDARAALDCARDLALVVRLDERRKPKFMRKGYKVPERGVVQHCGDEQRSVRTRGARGGQLIARCDEVLVENRKRDRGADLAQIVFVSEEAMWLAENRERRGARRLKLPRQLHWVELLAYHTLARRRAL